MLISTLLPGSRALRFERVKVASQGITIDVASALPTAKCPACHKASSRVHSRYTRKLMDLPWHGSQVQLHWRSRRFFCDAASCPRKIFTERLPDVAAPHARTTRRMAQALRAIGMSCGGEGGARLARRLSMLTSPDRLLRSIRFSPRPSYVTPRVLGVDDWAFRRGRTYGTILCDLERRCAVDLLPERSSEAFQAWLQSHPGVEIISRDRGDYYIKGATAGAPHATQVADRWHLLTNLREALMRAADRFSQQILEAARAVTLEQTSVVQNHKSVAESPENVDKLSSAQKLQQERRGRRFQRYEQVLELKRQRISNREIARRLKMHRGTVRRFLNAGTFPERATRACPRKADSITEYLRQRWEEGCQNAAQLTHELRRRGFLGSYYMVRRRVARWRKRCATTPIGSVMLTNPHKVQRPSSNNIAWLLLYPPADVDDPDHVLLEKLCLTCPQLATASRLATEFVSLLKEKNAASLDGWVERACRSVLPDLRRFAEGLKNDWEAVKAAFSLPWSNGQTEGHVNRLKMIKRQMFGRAKFDLLRQRFLNAA